VIELASVTKIYTPEQGPALDKIDLKIGKGDFVVLRGPSGSGKTTLLVLVAGMLRPTSGEIFVDNQKLSKLSSEQRARFRAQKIGFVFQMFHLVPYLNVTDNISLAVSDEREYRSRILELLSKLGLEKKVDCYPAELSAGEKQRTAIVRALVNRPPILLADEPTGNLDPENSRVILSHLSDYHHQGGTVVLASHNDMADSFAGRVIELKDGRLTEPGS
jgi:ABC-type lipoprotein export system ATPase subunit